MSGRISPDFIDELIQRVDIVELINSYIPLKKAGNNHVARCPFHNEKTASFSVTPEKQFYYCFGCGATGNAITFLMEYSNLRFVDAVEDLASFVGVAMPSATATSTTSIEQGHKLKALYELQSEVANYYQNELKKSKAAIEYLKRRGLKREIIIRYGIGFASPGWNNLAAQFDLDLLIQAGLVVKNEQGKSYDRFRNRIIFPIQDARGRTIGFGGRVLDQSTPKYLNSPETPTFHKGKEAYGLYELRKLYSKPERILVTEGYMDVISLAQFGIDFSVATLGTATSKDHINLLFRSCSELVFCFDGDAAGQQAAWRALEASLESLRDGRQIRFMTLPKGHDPDSMVREEGKENFLQRLGNSTPLSDHFFQKLTENNKLIGIEDRTRLVESAVPLLSRIPNGIYRDLMYSRLTELSRVEKADLLRKPNMRARKNDSNTNSKRIKPSAVRTAIALLLKNPQLVTHITALDLGREDSNLPGLNLLRKLADFINENPTVSTGGIIERFRGLPEQPSIEKLIRWDILIPAAGIEQEFTDAIVCLHQQLKKALLEDLLAKANTGDLDEVEQKKLKQLLTISKS